MICIYLIILKIKLEEESTQRLSEYTSDELVYLNAHQIYISYLI
jgi:hypothetical protein